MGSGISICARALGRCWSRERWTKGAIASACPPRSRPRAGSPARRSATWRASRTIPTRWACWRAAARCGATRPPCCGACETPCDSPARSPPWRGRRVPLGDYLQQWIAGVPGSIVFAADGRRAVPLGVSGLLAGERAFGAGSFRYCGNILGGADARLVDIAGRIADAVTREFRLVGVNGIDFVVRGGVPYPLEVNPRYTAALELVERAHGLGIFETHARACAGELPDAPLHRRTAVIGKAIVYARRNVVIGDTSGWLEDESVRDIPSPGQRIGRGHPVCTVFAQAPNPAACHAALVRRARSVYHEIEARERRIA